MVLALQSVSNRKEQGMCHIVLWLGLFGITLSGGPCCSQKEHASSAADNAASRGLEQLKSLAGEWEQTGEGGPLTKGATAVSYRTTAGGSAVVEVLFPGTEMEMMSVYHLDGKHLVMTHYCMVGNQPRMRARLGTDSKRIDFELIGGANLDPNKDPHIHGGVIEWLDRDRLRSEWQFYSNGKLIETHKFELVRKRS
jgi:hypothetical protein